MNFKLVEISMVANLQTVVIMSPQPLSTRFLGTRMYHFSFYYCFDVKL